MMGNEMLMTVVWCLACCFGALKAQDSLRIVQEWATLDFVFPNDTAREAALASGEYVPLNCLPLDVDVQHYSNGDSRMFVTIPRFGSGRPVTLGTVQPDRRIAPYPDYSWNANPGLNCDGITSVYRVAIDKCNRLWVMDTGVLGAELVCTPQLLAFDLENDELLFRHKIPEGNYVNTSLFVNPIVDSRENDCKNTFVYVADVLGFAILVVDVDRDRSWRITHPTFKPNLNLTTFTVDGESFMFTDGIQGMALSPLKEQERDLYFHAFAAITENVIKTSLLRDDSFIKNSTADENSVKVFEEERPNQSSAEAMDENGILYFGLMDPPSIYCWNRATKFSPKNFHVVAINQETLQFASGVKVIENWSGEQELWVLTNSIQRLLTGSITDTEINFRIHTESISVLMKDHACFSKKKNFFFDYRKLCDIFI